jgi:hypothetical protein
MVNPNPKKIAVISMMRNDNFFVTKWINYYGSQFGHENLYLIIDGHDQPLPNNHNLINTIRVPHIELSRSKGDKNRSRMVSNFARALFYRYDIVIAHDIDEFLVIDPNQKLSLAEYLQQAKNVSSISALGLDVGQQIEMEQPIDLNRNFLEQRSYAHVSARYTKPVVANKPITWGSGFHRVKWKNFHIDPNLFLFHFGMVDYNTSKQKAENKSLHKAGWTGHLDRRLQLFDLILKSKPIDGDAFFRKARIRQQFFRPIYALNKPGTLREKPIIKIPNRFSSIL